MWFTQMEVKKKKKKASISKLKGVKMELSDVKTV